MDSTEAAADAIKRAEEAAGVTRYGGMARAEHLEWAKQRALAYVERGDLQNAFTSLASDLRKHPELADHPGIELGMMQLMGGLSTPADMRRYIEGFN
jgi:hypothetical protein